MRIVDVRETIVPIASPIKNAFIDFSKMTCSLVAVVTDVVRDGNIVVGYGFHSNGRYAQSGLMEERFIPRLRHGNPHDMLNDAGDNLDPERIWAMMMKDEKPGGHGERCVAVGAIDMAVWDATAKIANKPLFRLLGRAGRKRSGSQSVCLFGRRLLRTGQRSEGTLRRNALLSRRRLLSCENEDRQ